MYLFPTNIVGLISQLTYLLCTKK